MRTVAFAVLCAVASVCSATTYYVSTTGNDSNDGLSSQSAFFTLAKAVDVATNSADAAEILIASGAYEQSAAIRVEAPLSIRGTGAAATNVVLKNTTSGQHVITLAHADAELALVSLTGGSAAVGSRGAAVSTDRGRTWRWSDFEIPFANARRMTLMPPQFRLFGRDIALALKAYLEPFK